MKLWSILSLFAFSLPLNSFALVDIDKEIERLERESREATPARLYQLISSGWSPSYENVERSLHPRKSYLLISSTEPGTVLDLRSAEHFRQSVVPSVVSGRDVDIGHVWIGWKCVPAKGPIVQGMTGQAGNTRNQFLDLVKAGWGLAGFKSHFLDGILETPTYIEMANIYAESSFHTLALEVDPKSCASVAEFVKEYIYHPKNPRSRYGLEGNPLSFDGGGCGSFALAAFGKNTSLSPIANHFWRDLKANGQLFGYGIPHSKEVAPFSLEKEGKRSISFFSLLYQNWTGTGVADPGLRILDPELLNLWFKTIYRSKQKDLEQVGGERLRAVFARKDHLNLFNFRNTSTKPQLPIDESFDLQSKGVVESTKKWVENYSSRLEWLDEHPAVILERK